MTPAQIWTDALSVHLVLPGSTATVSFPLTEAGLSRALRILAPQPTIRPTKAQPEPKFTPEIEAGARGVLRKLGMI